MIPLLRCFYRAPRRSTLILFVFAFRSAIAIGISGSWARVLAPENVLALPKGDRELFAPGAAVLLRILFEQEHKLIRYVHIDLMLCVGLIVIGSAISATVLSGLVDFKETRGRNWILRSIRITPSIVVITISCWLFWAALLYFLRFMYPVIPALVYPIAGEKGSDFALVFFFALALFAGVLAVVVGALARAVAVKAELGPLKSLSFALCRLRAQFGKCVTGAAGWIALTIAGPATVEYCLPSADSLAPTQFIVTVLAHQVTVLGLCALHLCWWSFTLDLVQRQDMRPHTGNLDH